MKRISVKSTLQTAFLLLTVSALSACGFHLRGNYLVPQEISSISLTSFDQFSQLTRDVDAQLRLNDIELVPPSASIPNLHLVNESVGERTLSLYQNSKAAEIELTYTTSYRVTIPDVGSKTFTTNATRNYLDNPRAALAKSVERDLIVDEMRKQTATQIMRQLARLKAEIDSGFTQFDPIEEQPSAANSANQ
ncbi:LPS-assembly lipoprotein LptE [Vibrio sp. MACH09]|uniref:LPS-assembly lipoprotein LptE n=1 Tax=unclassified Vibrio TaxID=2614977 RepID=UPI0014939970|nr:LPS assembly lipoprotein LptE [Vibrio sp. MACH09]NOI64949.1 luciferase [Vibrio sp. 99-8-1]GLO61619.1 LPS-assembly lipoprotein LptE [Vibrio sp. MACH09]